ncbi:MAG: hypothetical protein GXO20_04930 [Thermodesulfobacteria bacterium]|nr:hypothetical protein [Thermodesulfobacteriota bacterium]
MRIVIKLYYEETWVARGEGFYLTAPSLLELKERLENSLAERGLFPGNEVALIFDRARMPSWLVREIDYKEILLK